MTKEEIRKMLGQFLEEHLAPVIQIFTDSENQPPQWRISELPMLITDALASSPGLIMIEAEVEHNEDDGKTWLRRHLMPGVDDLIFYKRGFHGTPGPYFFFGLPREEEVGWLTKRKTPTGVTVALMFPASTT